MQTINIIILLFLLTIATPFSQQDCDSVVGCLRCSGDTCLRCDLERKFVAHPVTTQIDQLCLCQEGLYLNVTNKSCQTCQDLFTGECLKCTSNKTCDICTQNYFSNMSGKGRCHHCRDYIPNCEDCQRYNNDSLKIQCNNCNSQQFYLDNNHCVSCSIIDPLCSLCAFQGGQVHCHQCSQKGYWVDLQTGKCTLCAQLILNCQKCRNSTHCKTCIKGYFYDPQHQCQLCSELEGCLTCHNDGRCKRCLSNYYLTQHGGCYPCSHAVIHCALCSSNTTCIECMRGWHLQNGSCEEDPGSLWWLLGVGLGTFVLTIISVGTYVWKRKKDARGPRLIITDDDTDSNKTDIR